MTMKIRTWFKHTARVSGWLAAVCAVGVMIAGAAFSEDNWWNKDWQYRKKITIDTTASGADIQSNMTDIPVLLRLHAGNMNFSNARENGEDIRFVAADNKTLLKHWLESYSSRDGLGLAWIRIPKISGASNQDYIWMYYGSKTAVGGVDEKGTVGNSGAVFHFSESKGTPKDSSEIAVPVEKFSGGQGQPGVIGNGIAMNGLSDMMTIKSGLQLPMKEGFTFSTWIKIAAPLAGDAVLFNRTGDKGSLVIGIDKTNLYCQITPAGGKPISTEKTTSLSPGAWHHVAVTVTPAGMITIYLDGAKGNWVNMNKTVPEMTGAMTVAASVKGDRMFAGELDEVRLFSSALPADRIHLDYVTQTQGKNCLTSGQEMANDGGNSISYMSIVFKNITVDGWLIIICLNIMGGMSITIIITKALNLHVIRKENKRFREKVEEIDGKAALHTNMDDEFENSSLYKINQVGAGFLKKWVDPEKEGARISSREIDFLKSELDKNLVFETGRMNAWLVVLIMSISGAPFLGLLGTVWGVMSTFAGIAAVGEANIMAIAPGVASALAATVFGLLVAIPSLFGYNYLASQVRQISIDINMYADEYSLAVDRYFGGDK